MRSFSSSVVHHDAPPGKDLCEAKHDVGVGKMCSKFPTMTEGGGLNYTCRLRVNQIFGNLGINRTWRFFLGEGLNHTHLFEAKSDFLVI